MLRKAATAATVVLLLTMQLGMQAYSADSEPYADAHGYWNAGSDCVNEIFGVVFMTVEWIYSVEPTSGKSDDRYLRVLGKLPHPDQAGKEYFSCTWSPYLGLDTVTFMHEDEFCSNFTPENSPGLVVPGCGEHWDDAYPHNEPTSGARVELHPDAIRSEQCKRAVDEATPGTNVGRLFGGDLGGARIRIVGRLAAPDEHGNSYFACFHRTADDSTSLTFMDEDRFCRLFGNKFGVIVPACAEKHPQ